MCLLIKTLFKKRGLFKTLEGIFKIKCFIKRAYLLQSLSSYKTNQNPVFVIIKEKFFKDYHSFLIK
ncbi:hypothetical protein HPSH112_01425 [Helicobacter pylori Shi112]|nr:hypothetical protein HPSH112_01425 [Helicobacter pylori Shi112]